MSVVAVEINTKVGPPADLAPPAWVFLSSPHVPLSSSALRALRESAAAS